MSKIYVKFEKAGVMIELAIDGEEVGIPDDFQYTELLRETIAPIIAILTNQIAGLVRSGQLIPIFVDSMSTKLAESAGFSVDMISKVQRGELDPQEELLKFLENKNNGFTPPPDDLFGDYIAGLDLDDI